MERLGKTVSLPAVMTGSYWIWSLGMAAGYGCWVGLLGMAGRAEHGWSAWGKQSPSCSVASTARAALAGSHKTEGRGAPATASRGQSLLAQI